MSTAFITCNTTWPNWKRPSPQGLTFGPDRHLYIVDALAGSSGLHRLEADGSFTPIVAGGTLIGVAFGPGGELVVASNETAYRFE